MARVEGRYERRRFPGSRFWNWARSPAGSSWLTGGIIVLISAYVATYYWAESLWFADLAFGDVFRRRSLAQLGIGFAVFAASVGFALFNLNVEKRYEFNESCLLPNQANLQVGLGLRLLLPLVLGLGMVVGGALLYHVELAVIDVRTVRPPIPVPLGLNFRNNWLLVQRLMGQPVEFGLVVASAIAMLAFPKTLIRLGAVALSVSFAIIAAEEWVRIVPALNPTAFGQVDPLFQEDLSYYIFRLPLWEWLEIWLSGMLLFLLAAAALEYLLAGNTLSQGRFSGFSGAQQRHLYSLAAGLLAVTALGHWLGRYELLYSPQGVSYGASFTDVHVNLPVNVALAIVSLAFAIVLLWRTAKWPKFTPQRQILRARAVVASISLYVLLALLGNTLAPWLVQRLVVQPNELGREIPYLERTIAFSREAFDLESIETRDFNPGGQLTAEDLEENDLTIRNIRLWDTRPLLESNRQLQQIRLYYEFADADVDRYTLVGDVPDELDRRQVLISARELDYEQVPDVAKTWVNEHLIYTHGYGFTMSPVNTAGAGGLPDYFIRDIAHEASDPAVARSIPVGKPRLYFGELTNTYVMTDTDVEELDFPQGSENQYNTYDGDGGIGIGPLWKRLLFAKHLGDWKMLLAENFTSDTRLLYRRNIRQRVEKIAPFLQFDADPYLVVADAQGAYAQPKEESGENYLYWMIDAYTTSDRYPYSDPMDDTFNYIRNSVKVVVDAYNGGVHFYIADESDPIIQTWARIFPSLFEPLSDMPPALLSHIRYPQDFSAVQSNHLLTYHMIDPQVFYNREDQWRAPNEIYANEEQVVEPYYLIMELPGEDEGEFVLLRPFTPAQRNNMIAWLAARSDGEQYGRQLLYQFPKQELIFGPEQIEARINQEPEISQRISLWNTQGSRANQGNLLVIPIEDSLLYVEPLYLEAEQNRLPILARVIVAYKNRIAMADTLNDALQAIFDLPERSSEVIIRDLGAQEEAEGVPLPSAEDTDILNDLTGED